MRKLITSLLATAITATSAFPIDLSNYEYAPKPAPAPVVEHVLPHVPWDRDAHSKFFDLMMSGVMGNEDLDPLWTTPMLVDAVKCMAESFSSDYSLASFLGEWELASDEFQMEIDVTTEICFTASYVLHSTQEEIKYY